jgi:hypothetical protein
MNKTHTIIVCLITVAVSIPIGIVIGIACVNGKYQKAEQSLQQVEGLESRIVELESCSIQKSEFLPIADLYTANRQGILFSTIICRMPNIPYAERGRLIMLIAKVIKDEVKKIKELELPHIHESTQNDTIVCYSRLIEAMIPMTDEEYLSAESVNEIKGTISGVTAVFGLHLLKIYSNEFDPKIIKTLREWH